MRLERYGYFIKSYGRSREVATSHDRYVKFLAFNSRGAIVSTWTTPAVGSLREEGIKPGLLLASANDYNFQLGGRRCSLAGQRGLPRKNGRRYTCEVEELFCQFERIWSEPKGGVSSANKVPRRQAGGVLTFGANERDRHRGILDGLGDFGMVFVLPD
jgi:hypothetical protein